MSRSCYRVFRDPVAGSEITRYEIRIFTASGNADSKGVQLLQLRENRTHRSNLFLIFVNGKIVVLYLPQGLRRRVEPRRKFLRYFGRLPCRYCWEVKGKKAPSRDTRKMPLRVSNWMEFCEGSSLLK